MATIKTVGKAKIELHIRGCIDCGTEYSSGWEVAKIIQVKIGRTNYEAQVYRCADCLKGKQRMLV